MKILFIQKEGGIFGAENFHLKIIPALQAKGVVVHFLRLYTTYQGGVGGAFIERLNSLGVETHELNIGKYPKPAHLTKIKQIIRKGAYSLVQTHLIHADLYLSLIRLFAGGIHCPWVSTKHGYDNAFTAKYGFNPKKQSITPYYLLARLSERLCDKSYTISHGLHHFFIATGLTKPNKMEMIHYGFDFEELDMPVSGFKKFKKQIVIVGRLVAFKGHTYLLQALQILVKKDADIGLVIVGSGKNEAVIKKLVQELHLQKQVHFAGYSKQAAQWMLASDVVTVPSISEGFGVVFLEAFNAKTPVVAWDVPAGNELIEHRVSGLLAKPYDINDLSNKISEAINDTEKAELMADNAYKKLKEYFTLERMAQETFDFYQKVIKK